MPQTDKLLIATTSAGFGMVIGALATREGQFYTAFLVGCLLAATGVHILTRHWKERRP